MPLFKNITAIIYDLDGTIIDTDQLHLQAWQHTGRQFGFEVTAEQFAALKGLSSRKTLEGLLSSSPERWGIIPEAAEVKFRYLMGHLQEVQILGHFIEAYQELASRQYQIGVCTSARQEFVEGMIKQVPALAMVEGKVVWKEMFKEGKPSAEPLLTTLRFLGGLAAARTLYVGDGYADYGSAQNAGMPFVYFCPKERDSRLPAEVPLITDHRELLPYLEWTRI